MPATLCHHYKSFCKCRCGSHEYNKVKRSMNISSSDNICPYTNFEYKDKCPVVKDEYKKHDKDDDDDGLLGVIGLIASAGLGSIGDSDGFGGFGDGDFGGGGSGGEF